MNYAFVFLFIMLGIFSFLDIKYKQIPSILLTSVLFILSLVFFKNISFGIVAFILSYGLFELGYLKGIADLKVIPMIALTISSFYSLFIYFILISGIGIVWFLAYSYYFKDSEEQPFIPVLFVCFVFLWIGGLL